MMEMETKPAARVLRRLNMNRSLDDVQRDRYLAELTPVEREKVDAVFKRVENLAALYARRAVVPDFKGVRKCYEGGSWGGDGEFLKVGVKLLHRHTWKGLKALVAHEIGHAKHAYGWPSSYAQSNDSQVHILKAEFFADEVGVDVSEQTVFDWARGMLGALKIEEVDIGEFPCGGETLATRYDHLAERAGRGYYQLGKPMDFRHELRKFGYPGLLG